ncbi:MAG: ABC transporter substrate-binding protein [Chloroflexi bacterium]|nr:ABC transporter substrate-binding protein [Chloroflexota bacterium]
MRYTRPLPTLSLLLLPLLLAALACQGAQPAPTATPKPPLGAPTLAPPTPAAQAQPAPTQIVLLPTPTPAKAAAPAPTASAELKPEYGGVIRVGQRRDPDVADPARWSSITYQQPQENLYSQLVARGYPDETNVQPDVAERWELSSDRLTWTFYLRRNVKWHDGTPLTARDVEFWIKRGQKPPTGVTVLQGSIYKSIAKIEVVDDYTIRFTTDQPRPGILYELSNPNLRLAYPRHLYEGKEEKTALAPDKTSYIGSGPFKFDDYRRGSYFQVKRNPDYYRSGLPYLDGAQYFITQDAATHFALFRVGRLDLSGRGAFWYMTGPQVETLKREMGDKAYFLSFASFAWHLHFNPSFPQWRDVRIRKAITLWLNRQEAIKAIVEGQGQLIGYFVPGSYYAHIDWAKTPGWRVDKTEDRATAKKLLADAGYPNGFTATLLTRDLWVPTNEWAAGDLKGLGIALKMDVVDQPTREERVNRGQYEMDQATIQGLTPEEAFLEFHSSSATGTLAAWKGRPETVKVDQMLERAVSSFDVQERQRLMFELEEYIYLEQVLTVPIEEDISTQALRSYVHGYRLPNLSQAAHNELTIVWMSKR